MLTVAMAFQIPGVQADFTPADLFGAVGDPDDLQGAFEREFGSGGSLLMVLVVGDDVLSTEALDYLHRLTTELGDLDGVRSTASITTAPIPRPAVASSVEAIPGLGSVWRTVQLPQRFLPIVSGETVDSDEADLIRRAIEDAPWVDRRLISADRTVAPVLVFLEPSLDRASDIEVFVEGVEARIGGIPGPDGYASQLAGLPYVRSVVVQQLRADQAIFLPTALLISVLILALVFRSTAAVLLPVLAVLITLIWVVGGMALVGESFNIVNNTVPVLLLVIGLSDGIHLVSRYGEARRAGQDPIEASESTLRYMARACFLTSVTTAAGFASLGLGATPLLRRFGLLAALGVLFAYLVTVLILPASLAAVRADVGRHEARSWARLGGALERLAQPLTRRAGWVLLGTVVVAAVAVSSARNVVVDNAVLDQLNPRDPVSRSSRLLESKLLGFRPLELWLRAETSTLARARVLNQVDELNRWAEAQPGVIAVTSPTDALKEIRRLRDGIPRDAPFVAGRVGSLVGVVQGSGQRLLTSFISEDGDNLRVTVSLEDMGAIRTGEFADDLLRRAEARFAPLGVEVRLTGDAWVASQGLQLVIEDLTVSVASAFGLVFVFVSLILGSIRLGLLSVPPTVVPMILTAGYMGLRGIPLNVSSVIIFSVGIGLAVDGSIHLLARYQHERELGFPQTPAIRLMLGGAGRAVALTYVALALGFVAMLFSAFIPIRRFGELIILTVISCMVASVVLVPALLATFERRRPRTRAD